MPRLRALTSYRHDPRNLRFVAGEEFDATDELAAYLTRDAPGCFEEVIREKALDEPRRDKMVRRAPVDKSV